MSVSPSIVWFRNDLRLADNPALHGAVQRGGSIVPVFIYAPDEESPWSPGGATRWWMHQSLGALDPSLRTLGSRLVIRRGLTEKTLLSLAKDTGANAVFWNRRYEPAVIARDAKVKEVLNAAGLEAKCFNAGLLHEPWTIQNQSGKPFQVFTPFWKHCLNEPEPAEPLPAPKNLPVPAKWPKSLALEELELEPKIKWDEGMRVAWEPGEAGAMKNLREFLVQAFDNYSEKRNRPDVAGTSRLSPHLHFGEISPRQIWHGLKAMAAKRGLPTAAWRNSQFLAEVGWREFAHHLLFHFPHTPAEPLRPQFKHFPWRKDAAALRAWQKGRTGYPIVDAGMRELWTTGWMHNRVRMIAASFLVKDLLLPWQDGARWFWDTLVDADLASNTLGWQWTAGCVADAAPYFRIFNPVSQAEKFDPQGEFVRRWIPELKDFPDDEIHQPWENPLLLTKSKYPPRIVLHADQRGKCLAMFKAVK
jgi:deoxyribodipyrimidine photo-lyase